MATMAFSLILSLVADDSTPPDGKSFPDRSTIPQVVPLSPDPAKVEADRAIALKAFLNKMGTVSTNVVSMTERPDMFAGQYVIYLDDCFTMIPKTCVPSRAKENSVFSDKHEKANTLPFKNLSEVLKLISGKIETIQAIQEEGKPTFVNRADIEAVKSNDKDALVMLNGLPCQNFKIK